VSVNIDELVSRLQKGEDPEQVLLSGLPASERALLRRCAVVRSFDRELVEGVLRPAIPDLAERSYPYEELVRREDVHRVPRSAERYRLLDGPRRRHLEEWRKEDPGFREEVKKLNCKLARHYRRRGVDFDLEVLFHSIACSPKAAGDLFDRLYAEADARFDLASCTDLLAVLDDRRAELDRSLAALRLRRRAGLQARTLWASEYHQSIHYHQNSQLTAALDRLLTKKDAWILHLFASGGMGKTSFVRWVLARKCAPEPPAVPCARIDFDVFDPVPATREPWRLLVEIARQLDEQIPGRPFYELTTELGEQLGLRTARKESRSSGAPQSNPAGRSQALEGRVRERFLAALADARLGKPVLLVFDTVEEVILSQEASFMRLLEEVALVHRRHRQVRLLLCGRTDLNQRLAGFTAKFGQETRTQSLLPWTPREARDYLEEDRGLSGHGAVPAVIERAAGNPFKLAIYADLLRSNPELTARQIESYGDADLAYLIERVVRRIQDEGVRWLLRYGVIPRRLSRAFLAERMVAWLAEARAGRSPDDDPSRDPVPDAAALFPTHPPDAGASLDPALLWRRLTQYAGQLSWVSLPGDDPDTLVFHGDVVNPMRRLLAKAQPATFARLHQDAFRFYDAKAAGDPPRRVEWTREAVYHLFQAEGASAIADWRRRLEAADESGDVQLRHDLALEVSGAEYVQLLDPAVRAEAALELARARLDLVHQPVAGSAATGSDYALVTGAQSSLDAAESIERSLGRAVVSPERKAWVRAWLLSNRGDQAQALATLVAVPGGSAAAKPRDVLRLRLLRASLLAPAAALTELRLALELARQMGDAEAIRSCRLKIAQLAAETLDYVTAAGEMQAVLAALGDTAGDRERTSRIERQFAEICLDAGQLGAANEHLERAERTASALPEAEAAREQALRFLVRGRYWLALQAPEVASDTFRSAIAIAEQYGGDDRAWPSRVGDLATAREQLGLALAECLDHQGAMLELDQAQSLFVQVSAQAAAARALRHKVILDLRDLENHAEAELLLQSLQFVSASAGAEAETWLALLQAEAALGKDDSAEARKLLAPLLAHSSRSPGTAGPETATPAASVPPSLRLQVASSALLLGPRPGDEAGADGGLAALIAGLRAIEPPQARAAALDPGLLRRARPLGELPAGEAAELAELLPDLLPGSPEAATLALPLAELLRIAGLEDRARQLLAQAEKQLAVEGRLFGLRKVAEAQTRLGWKGDPPAWTAPAIPGDPHPMLGGLLLLQEALRHYLRRDLAKARSSTAMAKAAVTSALPGALSVWIARILELEAEIDEVEGNVVRAGELRRQAETLYRHLGADRRRSGLSSLLDERTGRANFFGGSVADYLAAMDAGSEVDPREVGDGFWIRIALRGASVRVATLAPSGGKEAWAVREVPAESPLLAGVLRTTAGETFVEELITPLARAWPEAYQELTGVVLSAEQQARFRAGASTSPGDVILEIEPGALAALPWELMTLSARKPEILALAPAVRLLYRSGRAFREDLGSSVHAPRAAKAGECRVLILQPSAGASAKALRDSSEDDTGLAARYRALGFVVRVLEDPTLEQVSRLSRDYQPNVVLMSATLKESPSFGGVYLDFATTGRFESAAAARTDLFTSSGLFNALGRGSAPLVVLDIAYPRRIYETVRQLLLRNAFASQLLQREGIRAVLGTGLASLWGQQELGASLAEGLAAGLSLREIVVRMRLQRPPLASGEPYRDLEELLPFVGTTLFADDPDWGPVSAGSA